MTIIQNTIELDKYLELENNHEKLYKQFLDLQEQHMALQEKHVILQEEYLESEVEHKKTRTKYLDSLTIQVKALEELKDMREEKLERLSKANETGETVIHVKHYPESDKRYENIMSHMDILWHAGETGPDGCEKCEDYRNIMMSAFDKVERMSSRDISQDFSTKHINGDSDKEVNNNNNHIYQSKVTGQIRGGDKNLDDMEFYGDES